jgi:hypothetical protein
MFRVKIILVPCVRRSSFNGPGPLERECEANLIAIVRFCRNATTLALTDMLIYAVAYTCRDEFVRRTLFVRAERARRTDIVLVIGEACTALVLQPIFWLIHS